MRFIVRGSILDVFIRAGLGAWAASRSSGGRVFGSVETRRGGWSRWWLACWDRVGLSGDGAGFLGFGGANFEGWVVFWAHRSAAGWIRGGREEGADGVVLISSVCFGELGRTFRDVGLALLARLLLCCLILENADRFESSCLRCGIFDASRWTDSAPARELLFEWDFFGTR